MRHSIILFLLLSINWATRAQFVFVPGSSIDFGTVENWRNEPAVFNLVNTGNKPLAILKIIGSKDIVTEYSRNYLQPGDTGKIILRYYTPSIGPFTETVEVFLTADVQPAKLTLKGKIKSIGEDALTACPTNQIQGTSPNFYQQFSVLDYDTREAIPAAHFFVGTRGQMVDEFKTPNSGRAVHKTYGSGMYVLQISAEKYTTVDTGIVILAGQRSFIFYLRKTEPESIPIAVVPTPVEPDPAPAPTPQPVVTPRTTPLVADSIVETNTVLPLSKYKPNNIVFVLDVSSSMRLLGRLDMLKESMLRLTEVLRAADKVSIITFTTTPVTRIQAANGGQKDTLNKIIRSFTATGATNGIKGLRSAYEMAERNFIADGNNMVIFGTDGVFNQADENGVNVTEMVDEYLRKDIKLGVMAFGRDEVTIKSMEKIAAKGQGGFMRMDNADKAPQLLLQQIQIQSAR